MPKTASDHNPDGMVLEIVRMSTEDGPGIRTTVFFKGCPLNCAWCHNPESISPKPQLCWVGNRCIGCMTCLDICENDALSKTESGIEIDRKRCRACGKCAAECPGTALELLGRPWGVADLVNEVIKDRAYFEASGGGVTVSGGEPTLQPEFMEAFLTALRERGLHTALDTCGLCSRSALDRLLPHAALVMFDIKLIDPVAHKRFTGHGNTKILKNLEHAADYIRAHLYPDRLWIRTPLIPGATATVENISGIGRFIADRLDGLVSRWELCAFNNLCRDKYRRLGHVWAFDDTALLRESDMEMFLDAAKRSGVNPDMVCGSGATRLEPDNEKEEVSGGI